MFEDKLICWFLPGLKTQANAKTEGTHEKAVILGGYSLCTHIIWVHQKTGGFLTN